VNSVREWCEPDDWTAEVRMKEGALPDLDAWDRAFRDFVGESLKIRGVELTVVGTVVEVGGKPALRLEDGKTLVLIPLGRKVQWDPKRNVEQQATPDERDAHRRLISRHSSKQGGPPRVKVTGPFESPVSKGEEPTLMVRTFADAKP
jgi:hypothetical protein